MFLALMALVINAAIPINALRLLDRSHDEMATARATIGALDQVMLSMVDAQTGSRGYIITGNPDFLEPYYKAITQLDDQLLRLQGLVRHDKSELKHFRDIEEKCKFSLERLRSTIATRQSAGAEAAMAMVASAEGKRRMDAVRAAVENLRTWENAELDKLKAENDKIFLYTSIALVVLTIIDFILLVIAFVTLYRALKASRQTEIELARLHAETTRHGELLALKNRNKDIQARLADVLQTVISPEEAYLVIEKYCSHLFPGHPGMFYVRSNSKDYFELKASWNGGIANEGFEPNDCWAARNNQVYRFNVQHDDLPCMHIVKAKPELKYAICLPISSTNEMIGIMTLAGPQGTGDEQQPVDPGVETLAQEVVNQIGLAIANLRLRDSLRKSSILDALTGLFNRRYLDETLPREIARAERTGQPIGIIMLDIDHFKVFNDTYGHDAGDMALREMGPLLRRACRASDVACRYGGEEFMVILPDADLKTTIAKAEFIRTEVRKLRLKHGGVDLPGVTASLGVSAYPMHGSKPAEVIKAADEALYRAKESGRDRVEVAPDPVREKTGSVQ